MNVMKCHIDISAKKRDGIKCSSRGAPNDGFLLNTLKTLFRQSRMLLDL